MIGSIFKSLSHLQQIKRMEFQAQESMQNYQWQCLQKTLRFACENIPFYMDTYRQAGIRWQDIRTWDDFKALPILTKNQIRSHPPEAFFPRGKDPHSAWKSQTTGSSGVPITIFRDKESTAWDRAFVHYGFNKLGIHIYHRFCQILAILSDKPQQQGPLEKLGVKRNFVVNLRQTDEAILNELKAIMPHVILTYPSVFLRLAEHLKKNNLQFKIRTLIAQGEALPESWRSKIQETFQAPLYHTYGTTEVARVGFECREQKGYHLIPQASVTEILRAGKTVQSGEEGEIVLTNLNNFCSPLIRYQIGDRGVLTDHACPCGLRFPLMQHITGRLDDFLVLPSGKTVSARSVTHMQFDGIVQYKIIQKTPADLQILVIPSEKYGDHTVKEMKAVLADAFLGEPVKIEILRMESLPVSRTGKLQLVTREFQVPGQSFNQHA